MRQRWDIFCRIVDNYGDIGVCWRLARQLATHKTLAVRLWVDDWPVARRIIAPLAANRAGQIIDQQIINQVEIRHWSEPFTETEVADVVIEAFACELPAIYLTLMQQEAQAGRAPAWLNLEFLSAESWIDDCHLQSSPHPTLGLMKHFFFPGFSPASGGLLREPDLIDQRTAFQQSPQLQANFWQRLGIVLAGHEDALKISLFCYPNAPLGTLMQAIADSPKPVMLLVPDSGLLGNISECLHIKELVPGECLTQGDLTLQVLPFLSPEDYDRLLWACDLNFVRGEDSWVRAIWAAKPLIWQPYRQADDTHLTKLEAFLACYTDALPTSSREAFRAAHFTWSDGSFSKANWSDLLKHLPDLRAHAIYQADQLAMQPDIVVNLLLFLQKFE